jgi:uncharacterized protein (DUF362 family)
MNRREFLKNSLILGGVTATSFFIKSKKNIIAQSKPMPDLVAIKGGEPELMFDNGIKALGGMSSFVKKRQKVVIKPNIGWARPVEYGANTHPKLVKRIIEHCKEAGAKKIYVFDHSCDHWENAYQNSGIEQAAKEAGAIVVPSGDEKYYQSVKVPNGKRLKETKVHELILDSDVFINVPVLKSHSSTRLTIAMKNLMGAVWDRGFYHGNGLEQCIADFCTYRKPDLNIVDAYNVMMKFGPSAGTPGVVENMKYQLISKDIVAIDAAASKIFGMEPHKVSHIKIASDMGIGNIDLDKLKIKRLTI